MTKKSLAKFIKNFKYSDHRFNVQFQNDDAIITKSADLKCATTKKMKTFMDHRKLAYSDFNEFELLNYMRNWMINLAIHENDELIRYKGKRVFNPHKVWSHIMET